MNNKKGIIILICTGATLLLGSLGITIYAVSRMNRVEELLVFTTETETTITTTINEIVETTTTMTTTIITEEVVTEITNTIPEEVVIETTVNDEPMTRGQWYEENGYGGYPDEEEQEQTYDHDEYMSVKNSNTCIGEFSVNVELVAHSIYGLHVNVSEGDAVAGVDTGLNIGDEIYVAGCGYFTIVYLTDSIVFEKDERIVCFATELLYGSNGLNLGYFDTDVYLIE